MSNLAVYAVYINHPFDHIPTGDYHHMYVIAEDADQARKMAFNKAVHDGGTNTGVWMDEFVTTVAHFDDEVPADAEPVVTEASQWWGPTCERPGCKSPRSCTHSVRETAEILAAEAEAAHDMPLTDECGECGAELEYEQAVGWVDAMSGDDGGTYDYCPKRRFAGHLPKRHELTCPAGTPGPGALPHG